MEKVLKFQIVMTVFFLFISCASNGMKPSKNSNTKEDKSKSQITTSEFSSSYDIKILGVFVYDKNGLRTVSKVPEELKKVKRGVLSFTKTNVVILVSHYYNSFDEATNEVIQKNDISAFIVSNFVFYDDGKDSNVSIVSSSDPFAYIFKDDFRLDKSYIARVGLNGNEMFKTLSIYTTGDEELERNIISVWEGICWDKSVNLNITEKFIRLITSNYQEIKKLRSWTN